MRAQRQWYGTPSTWHPTRQIEKYTDKRQRNRVTNASKFNSSTAFKATLKSDVFARWFGYFMSQDGFPACFDKCRRPALLHGARAELAQLVTRNEWHP